MASQVHASGAGMTIDWPMREDLVELAGEQRRQDRAQHLGVVPAPGAAARRPAWSRRRSSGSVLAPAAGAATRSSAGPSPDRRRGLPEQPVGERRRGLQLDQVGRPFGRLGAERAALQAVPAGGVAVAEPRRQARNDEPVDDRVDARPLPCPERGTQLGGGEPGVMRVSRSTRSAFGPVPPILGIGSLRSCCSRILEDIGLHFLGLLRIGRCAGRRRAATATGVDLDHRADDVDAGGAQGHERATAL